MSFPLSWRCWMREEGTFNAETMSLSPDSVLTAGVMLSAARKMFTLPRLLKLFTFYFVSRRPEPPSSLQPVSSIFTFLHSSSSPRFERHRGMFQTSEIFLQTLKVKFWCRTVFWEFQVENLIYYLKLFQFHLYCERSLFKINPIQRQKCFVRSL